MRAASGLDIVAAGPATSVQGGPRLGARHLGVPWSGAADALSLALANRLVGNAPDEAGLEVPFGGLTVRTRTDLTLAVTGGAAPVRVDGVPAPPHESLTCRRGAVLEIGAVRTGLRAYLAAAGGFALPAVLGSVSTYLPAGLGGVEGRVLRGGDALPLCAPRVVPPRRTPDRFRPPISDAAVLRAVLSAEANLLTAEGRVRLLSERFTVAPLSDRMGLRLSGVVIDLVPRASEVASAAVFPGTVQLPPGGGPILLGPDAQTTGGYPRVLSVLSCDLHLAGQLRPGATVRFYPRTPEEGADDVRAKVALWQDWLGPSWRG